MTSSVSVSVSVCVHSFDHASVFTDLMTKPVRFRWGILNMFLNTRPKSLNRQTAAEQSEAGRAAGVMQSQQT